MNQDEKSTEEESESKGESGQILSAGEKLDHTNKIPSEKEEFAQGNPPIENITLPDSQPTAVEMEVHHHTHTRPKKWKHYIFEFFMLFLAVFCGFLAEYQLEHVIEKNREKQYMQSMIEDLQADTLNIKRWLKTVDANILYVDSSLIIITNENWNDSLMDKLYRFYFPAFGIPSVNFTDRTSLQLKSSGSMRLIRKHIVADSILNYWNYITRINESVERLEYYRIRGRELGFKIFNIGARYVKNKGLPEGKVTTPTLIANNPQLLVEYGNYMAFMSAEISRFFRQEMINQHTRGNRLMNLIRKEYSLQ